MTSFNFVSTHIEIAHSFNTYQDTTPKLKHHIQLVPPRDTVHQNVQQNFRIPNKQISKLILSHAHNNICRLNSQEIFMYLIRKQKLPKPVCPHLFISSLCIHFGSNINQTTGKLSKRHTPRVNIA